MKKLITLIAIVGLVGFTSLAEATRGGEPNNTGCNGVGNANSPCQPSNNGGSGGNGGNGGNVTIKDSGNSRSTSTSTSRSNATGGKSVIRNSGNSTNTNRLNNTNDLSNKINNKVSNDTKVKNNVDASSKNKLDNSTKVKTGDVSTSSSANNEGVTTPVNVDASDNSSYEYKEVPQVAPVFAERGQVGFTFSTPVGGGGFNKDTKDSKLIDTYMTIQQAQQAELLDTELAEEATLNVVNKLLKRSCGKKCMVGVEEEKTDEVSKPVTTNNFAR